MSFNPPVPQQDSNREIRVAVLVSLLLQVLLIFMGPVRKRSSHPFPRFAVWSCYLLADWVADLALGLLLNNMGNIGSTSGSFDLIKRGGGGATAGNNTDSGGPIIFAFWTPFLLLHLGGPDTITSYSIEDNELWLRHLIGLLFELFSAAVIFFCSLRGNPMIHATTLMFVAGVIKYAERTYSLYCSSLESFRANILGPPEPGPSYAKLMTEFDSKEKAGLSVEIAIDNSREVEDAHRDAERAEVLRMVADNQSVEARAYDFFCIFRRLFVDLILSPKQRRISQAFFVHRSPGEAFEIVELELGFVYDMVYTKSPVAHTKGGWVLRSVCSACIVSALVIFFLLDKARISRVDVRITYALLLGGLALDAVALAMIGFSDRAAVFLHKSRRLRWLEPLTRVARRWWQPRRWSQTVARLNLITYCLGTGNRYRRRPCWLMGAMPREMLQDWIFIHHQSLREIKYYKTIRNITGSSGDQDQVVASYYIEEAFFDDVKNAAQQLRDKDDLEIEEVFNWRGKGVVEHLEEEIKYVLNRHYKEQMEKVLQEKDERLVLKEQIKEALKDKDKWLEEQISDALKIEDMDGHLEDQIKEALKINNKDDDELVEIKKVLSNHNKDKKFKLIHDSVVRIRDFDESLLLWHVATDLCCLRDKQGPAEESTVRMQDIGMTLSEYMLYLLIKQPEMLSARTGIWLMRYQDTCAEVRRFFASMDAWVGGHEDARLMLLRVNTSERPLTVKGHESKSVLFDAVILAKALRELDDSLMWELVTGVWMQMLLYAARKCPGSTHARRLNSGGDLITVIWLLMEHMGLGDAMQETKGAVARLIVHDH